MRIWDLPPRRLCRNHLLGEHRELHAVWSVITKKRRGYANHPEVARWRGKLGALFKRHGALVDEMAKRGYQHKSPLNQNLVCGCKEQNERIHTLNEQVKILQKKKCACRV